MGKAKPAKHTSAELKAKAFQATINRGGGAAGLADRKGGKVGHAKYKYVFFHRRLWLPLFFTFQLNTPAAINRTQALAKSTLYPLNRCHVCALQAPDLKTMQIHHENKHPKLPWEPEKCTNVHQETGGVTVQGIGVQGSKKKK